jgi:cell division protein FtsL
VSVAAPAPRTARPRRAASQRPRARTTSKQAARRRLSPAFLWIIVLAVLFAGIVALNVGALRATIAASKLEAETSAIKTQNADLASQVAGMSGYFRIATEAKRLGMVPSSPGRRAFIPFTPGTHVHHVPATKTPHDERPAGPATHAPARP